jgi:hypothetical protein
VVHGLSAGAVHGERDHLVDEAAALAGWQAIPVEDQPQLAGTAGEIGEPELPGDVVVVQLGVQPRGLREFPDRIDRAGELEIGQRRRPAAAGNDVPRPGVTVADHGLTLPAPARTTASSARLAAG